MASFAWNEENTLLLITLYKQHNILWNTSNHHYYNKSLKRKAWEALDKALGTAQGGCRNKMTALLASLRRERRKIRLHAAIGSSEPYIVTWYAYEALSFLNGKKKRREHSSTETEQPDITIKEEALAADLAESTEEEYSKSDADPIQISRSPDQESDAPETSLLRSALMDSTEPASAPAAKDEEVRCFCDFLASKMVKYSESTKNSVQHAIYDILYKADRGEFNSQNTQGLFFIST